MNKEQSTNKESVQEIQVGSGKGNTARHGHVTVDMDASNTTLGPRDSGHSTPVHKQPKGRATQVSIDGRMDKQNVGHAHSGIFFSLKRSEILTRYNMDEH